MNLHNSDMVKAKFEGLHENSATCTVLRCKRPISDIGRIEKKSNKNSRSTHINDSDTFCCYPTPLIGICESTKALSIHSTYSLDISSSSSNCPDRIGFKVVEMTVQPTTGSTNVEQEQPPLTKKSCEKRVSCLQIVAKYSQKDNTCPTTRTQQQYQQQRRRLSLTIQEEKNTIYTIPCRTSYSAEEMNMIWWKGIEWQRMIWRNTIEFNYEHGKWQTAVEEDNFCFYNGIKEHPAHIPRVVPVASSSSSSVSSKSVDLETQCTNLHKLQQQQHQQQQKEKLIDNDKDHRNQTTTALLSNYIDVAIALASSLDTNSQ